MESRRDDVESESAGAGLTFMNCPGEAFHDVIGNGNHHAGWVTNPADLYYSTGIPSKFEQFDGKCVQCMHSQHVERRNVK
jgi:hypothetical protein